MRVTALTAHWIAFIAACPTVCEASTAAYYCAHLLLAHHRDLSRDAELLVVVWSVDSGAVGGARIQLFNSVGAVAQGLQKLSFEWIHTSKATTNR
jgi:hypothetical protein